MFKFSSYAVTLSLLTHRAARAQTTCDSFSVTFTGACNYDNFFAQLSDECKAKVEDGTVFGTNADGTLVDAAAEVADLCEYDAPTQFVEVQGTYQLDRRYFAGGGTPVDGRSWDVDTGRIRRFEENMGSSTLISWPEYAARYDYNVANSLGGNGYPANMNLATSCALRTAMCCFTDDSGTSSTFEANGDDTTDVCRHDLRDSPQSSHIKEGWSVFPGGEASTHCVGFTWTDGDDAFIGNMMYDVSLRNTALKGYRKGVPGAPMCGCVEHMPVVERADCRTATGGAVTYSFEYSVDSGVTASNSVDVIYGPCPNGDLSQQYKFNHAGTDAESLIDAHLVGEGKCADDLTEYLNEQQFLHEGTHDNKYIDVNANGAEWELIVGEGIYFLPPDIDAEAMDALFRDAINADCGGRKCMVRRVCASCRLPSHRDIYYQRHTEIPSFSLDVNSPGVYFLDMFMNQWYNHADNQMGPDADYELFSSYADALSGDPSKSWKTADYSGSKTDGFGFPRNSGPSGYVWNEWNSYVRGGAFAEHHAFYVEKPTQAA